MLMQKKQHTELRKYLNDLKGNAINTITTALIQRIANVNIGISGGNNISKEKRLPANADNIPRLTESGKCVIFDVPKIRK